MCIWNFNQTKHRTLAVHICNLDWWGGIIILVLGREEIQAGRLKASRGPGTRKSSTFQINPTCSKGNPVKPNFFQAFNLGWATRFRSSTTTMMLQHILFGDFLNVREVVRSLSLSLSSVVTSVSLESYIRDSKILRNTLYREWKSCKMPLFPLYFRDIQVPMDLPKSSNNHSKTSSNMILQIR